MIKIVLGVEGMMCGMCESHVNDVIRKVGGVKKVSSSHAKQRTEVIAEDGADVEAMKEAVASQGYRVFSVETEPYEKKARFSKKDA
ncbi:MAG: cation transporter [Clostridia bacterium]|nr:cation transporter [Clostridia bacterium]